MREQSAEHPLCRRIAAVMLVLCMLLALVPAVAAEESLSRGSDETHGTLQDAQDVDTNEKFAAALDNEAVTGIYVTGDVSHTGDISRKVNIAIQSGGSLTYHYCTNTASKVSTESLANFTVQSGGKLVFFGDGKDNSYTTPHLIFRGDLTVEENGTVEADQDGSWNGILLAYGSIGNLGTITVKAVEGTTTPGGLYHAIDALYTGTPVVGSYKRNLCRTRPTGGSIVTVTGATGGTGENGAPKVGDVLYGTVDGYGATDEDTPAGAFTFRWLLDGAPQEPDPSYTYTVPLSAVGKVCSVELYEIGADYVFVSVTDKVVKKHSKYNERITLGTVSVDTSELLYVGGIHGNDDNDGSTPETALATANAAIAKAADGGTIVVCGDTAVLTSKTLIEDKALTFTNTDGVNTYDNPVLYMYKPSILSNVTLRGVAWQHPNSAYYCSVGSNVTLTLDAVTPKNFSYLQGNTKACLVVRNSTLSGAISGLLLFDSIELDASSATALANKSLSNDASNFILKNGSTLSVSKNINSLTSVGEGNTIQARKLSGQTLVPVTVAGPITVETGKPIALTNYFLKAPADGAPYLTSSHESLTADKFTLNDEGFTPVKYSSIIYAASRSVSTLAPADITAKSADLYGVAATQSPLDGAAFVWWKSGDEGVKQTLAATVDNSDNTFSAALSELAADTLYYFQAVSTVGGKRCEGNTLSFRTKPEATPAGSIAGSVTNNTGGACNITVTIEEGNTVRASQVLSNVAGGASSSFSFFALPDGFYNVVADNGAYKVTRLVEIEGGAAVVNVTLALGKTQSVVEIVTPDTPPAAVDGLPEQFEDENIVDNSKGNTGYTQSDKDVVTSGGSVELKLSVERKGADSVSADASLITEKAAGQTIPIFLDLSVMKTVVPTAAAARQTPLVSVPKLLRVVLPLPDEAVGKRNLTIYRVHDGAAEALPKADPGENGEWAEIRGANVVFYIRQFSTYAMGYTPPTSSGGGSTTYPPIIADGEHGGATTSPKNPDPGDNVVIAPKPDEGYLLDEVIVTDKNGKEVAVKDNGDGTYTFTQPTGKVTITVTFKPERPHWNPFVDVAEKDWFHDSVRCVYENGLMIGTSDTAFSPHGDTSRGMIVTILWRMEGEPDADGAAPFRDVAAGQYYSQAVVWGAENGIILGYDNGNYGPGDPITREQLAAILWRYARYRGLDVSVGESTNILSYLDSPQISQYAVPALQWACGAGVMQGKDGGRLDPGGHATRAETAAMLERFPGGLAESWR